MNPDNPPAFPGTRTRFVMDHELLDDPRIQAIHSQCNGLSMKDYFAAHAPITFSDAVAICRESGSVTYLEVMATLAVLRHDYAEAMLQARMGAAHG